MSIVKVKLPNSAVDWGCDKERDFKCGLPAHVNINIYVLLTVLYKFVMVLIKHQNTSHLVIISFILVTRMFGQVVTL